MKITAHHNPETMPSREPITRPRNATRRVRRSDIRATTTTRKV